MPELKNGILQPNTIFFGKNTSNSNERESSQPQKMRICLLSLIEEKMIFSFGHYFYTN